MLILRRQYEREMSNYTQVSLNFVDLDIAGDCLYILFPDMAMETRCPNIISSSFAALSTEESAEQLLNRIKNIFRTHPVSF